MADACTGVIRLNPIEDTASRIHSANGGFNASQDLEDTFGMTGWMNKPQYSHSLETKNDCRST